MTTNSELRKAIKEMAEELAEGVIKMISSMSLKQLAALTGNSPAPRSLAEPKSESKPARSKSAAAPSKAKSKPAKAVSPRKPNRRKGAEIEKLRRGVLDVLKRSDDWMAAKEIGQAIGKGVKTDDLSFPINYLRDRGLVSKKGDRSLAKYKITEAGKLHEGSFGKVAKSGDDEG